ncbi:MAG TPA: STAS domain-containing protein [Acidimicrobiales bacterium]|nr:STAS domain-containing protein [Acidimicrobiales bacterium]
MPSGDTGAPGDQPSRDLTTNVEELRDVSIVHVAGEIDISTVGDLESAIERARAHAGPGGAASGVVVIDLRGVTFLGAEGLRSLVSAQNRIAESGGSMRVVAPAGGGIIRRLLDLSGVGALLDLFETIESAVPADRD